MAFYHPLTCIYRMYQRVLKNYSQLIAPDTAKYFQVRPASVEHAIRTVIASCWDRYDHSDLNRVAGIELENMPTNSEFIDILVAYLRYGAYERQ